MQYKKNYTLLAQLAFLIFITSSAMAFTSSYLSVYLNSVIGANESQIGLFFSVSSIFNIGLSLIIAYISDKSNVFRKLMLIIGLISAIIGYILYGISDNFYMILIVSCSLIAVSSCITPQLFALSNEVLKEKGLSNDEINTKITFLRTIISLSYAIGPLIGVAILQGDNFFRLYIGTAVIYFIALLFVLFFFKSQGQVKREKVNKEGKVGLPFEKLLKVFILFLFIQTVHSLISSIFPVYITSELNQSNDYIGIISSFSGFVEIPLMLLLVYLSSKINLKIILFIGIVCGLFFIALFSLSTNIYVIIASYVLNAIFYSTTIGLGMAFFQSIIPTNPGITTTVFVNTSSVGKILSGFLLSYLGSRYQLIFISILLILIFCLCLLSIIKLKNSE